jgi:hypothetical protein
MNKHFLSLACLAAVVVWGISSGTAAPSTAVPSISRANHFVGYFEQDTDSDVQTDQNSEGDYDVFYDRLSSDGHWFNDDDYGYVWQPNVAVSSSSWRPYADGHWVWTDRGWFWESNENFGWATYHYGRWTNVDGVGWVWVPGRQWAPSWVSWRHTDNDDYVGWAPLPAESTFNVSIGVHPWADTYYDIGPAAYAFIRIGDFGRPSYSQNFVPAQESLGFYSRTTNITNITYNNNVVISNGPQFERVSQLVNQQGGQPLPTYKINYAAQTQANAAFKTSAQGNQLNVLAPPPTLRASATVKPQVARDLGRTQVDRGWKNVPEAQAKTIRQQSAQQAPPPQNLPAKPALPAKPQIQAVTKGEQHPANEPGKGPQAPGGQLKPFIEKPENKAAGEQPKGETPTARPVQPETAKPAEQPRKPPVATEERKAEPATQPRGESPTARPVQPETAKPAEQPRKPPVTEERKAEPATQPRVEPQAARPVQPETAKPAEQTRKPPVAPEERRTEAGTTSTERPRPNEVRAGEGGERAQPKPETKENVKPGSHEGAPERKKEETKKEPPPQR